MKPSRRPSSCCRPVFRLIVGGVVCAVLSAKASVAVRLHFRESAVVNDTIIRLGDIATVSGASDSRKREIAALQLGPSAPPGSSRMVNTAHLGRYYGRDLLGGVDGGADRLVRVATRGVVHTVGRYADTLTAAIRKAPGFGTGRVSIALADTAASWQMLDKPYTLSIENLPDELTAGPLRLRLVFRWGSCTISRPVLARVTVVVPVAVTIRPVERGEPLGRHNCRFEEEAFSRPLSGAICHGADLEGMQANRSLNAGVRLSRRFMEAIPAVEKGDRISIRLKTGVVSVEIPGRARESGAVGQKIWVENIQSSALIRTTVTGKNRVSVN